MKIELVDPRLESLPRYATDGSAAIDLMAMPNDPLELLPGEIVTVSAGIIVYISDPSIAGLVIPRSGRGRDGLVLSNTIGLIDSDYQGQIYLSLWNRNRYKSIMVKPFDRVAQLSFIRVVRPGFEVGKESPTERGTQGWGSTGV